MQSTFKKMLVGSMLFMSAMLGMRQYAHAVAQVPQQINYQAVIKNQSNNQTVPDGNYQITYRIYTTLTGGAAIWSETTTDTVSGGVLNHVLGSVSTLSVLPTNVNYYLTIQLNGDSEMSPREQLTSVGSALIAGGLSNGATWTGEVVGINTTYEGFALIVEATDTEGIGVLGYSPTYVGTFGETTSGFGAVGVASEGFGVYGESNTGTGVYGSSDSSYGVYGYSAGTTAAIYGYNPNGNDLLGPGVYGNGITGVYAMGLYDSIYALNTGHSSGNWAIEVNTPNGADAIVVDNGPSYFQYLNANGITSNGGDGVGVNATSVLGYAAVKGVSVDTAGGLFSGSLGVWGVASSAFFTAGVEGDSYSIGYGVEGNNFGLGYGVAGFGYANTGVYGSSTDISGDYAGVWGENDEGGGLSGYGNGVYGKSLGAEYGAGVYGFTDEGYGVYAKSTTDLAYALDVYAENGGRAINVDAGASYFDDIYINGTEHTSAGIAGPSVGIMLNSGTDNLELGDVVVIKGNSPAVLGEIPVTNVAKTSNGYDSGVIGVVDSFIRVTTLSHKASGKIQNAVNQVSIQRDTTRKAQTGDYIHVITHGEFKAIKADASSAPINPGDLLTTSGNSGYAMKAQPVVISGRPFYPTGCIIGKALGSLSSGQGLIPVFVSHQ